MLGLLTNITEISGKTKKTSKTNIKNIIYIIFFYLISTASVIAFANENNENEKKKIRDSTRLRPQPTTTVNIKMGYVLAKGELAGVKCRNGNGDCLFNITDHLCLNGYDPKLLISFQKNSTNIGSAYISEIKLELNTIIAMPNGYFMSLKNAYVDYTVQTLAIGIAYAVYCV